MVKVGEHTYGADKIKLFFKGSGNLTIGEYCSIARGCRVFLGGNHRGEWISTYPLVKQSSYTKGAVTIGNDVWTASHVKIKQGVTIGDGAVIATESFVTKDVPPYALVGGYPAKIIRYRFNKSQIADLLKISWWNWTDEEVRNVVPLMMSKDIDKFISEAKKIKGIE